MLTGRWRLFFKVEWCIVGSGIVMTHQDEGDIERVSRRFDVALFIVHPTLDPADITAALGLEAQHQRRVGDQRTPKGKLLSGSNPDTRWRHSVHLDANGQWFASQVAEFVDRLTPHKDFLRKVRSTGGTACVGIEFFGGGYFSDEIPRDTLAKILELELDLAIVVV
jgi:hypothetical protein